MSEITEEMLDEMVDQGLIEVSIVDGEKRYNLTQSGVARAEDFIHNTPEGASFYAKLSELK